MLMHAITQRVAGPEGGPSGVARTGTHAALQRQQHPVDGALKPRPPGSRAIKTVREVRPAAGRVVARVRSESLISAESPSPKLRLRAQRDSEGLGQP